MGEDELDKIPKPSHNVDQETLKEIVDRVRSLPDLDNRAAEEIIGYNEHGLPS